VHDVEGRRLGAFLVGHAHLRHVLAAEDADRRLAIACAALAAAALTVEKALHVGQEGDEFAVMTFVELLGVAAELVDQFSLRVVGGCLLQQMVVMRERAVFGKWHQLQRPLLVAGRKRA
jgi:hypothetical protein